MRLPVNSEQMTFMYVCGLFNMIILIFRSGASKGSVHMPVSLALGRRRQEDQEFMAILPYMEFFFN